MPTKDKRSNTNDQAVIMHKLLQPAKHPDHNDGTVEDYDGEKVSKADFDVWKVAFNNWLGKMLKAERDEKTGTADKSKKQRVEPAVPDDTAARPSAQQHWEQGVFNDNPELKDLIVGSIEHV